MSKLLITKVEFKDWMTHPVTKKLFVTLMQDRAIMCEGLIYDEFQNPDEVKGRCKTIDRLVNLEYEDLFRSPTTEVVQ